MDIHGKKLIAGEKTLFGFISPEEQIAIALMMTIIVGAVAIGLVALFYLVVGPYVIEPLIGLLSILIRSLIDVGIPVSIKKESAKVISVIIMFTGLYFLITRKNKTKVVTTAPKSMMSSATDSVPANNIGVPMFLGMPRRWWLYYPTDNVWSVFGTTRAASIEATSQIMEIAIKKITSSDGVALVGEFSIVFQVYDFFTATLVDMSKDSNIYVQMLDLLKGNTRSAVNNINYNGITNGYEDVSKEEIVNEFLTKVLEKEYGDKVRDPRGSGSTRRAKAHMVIRVGYLGICIHKVICKSLIAEDSDFQKAREAKLRAAGEAAAQKEMIELLKDMEGYKELKGKALVDQANLMLDRFHEEYYIDMSKTSSKALKGLGAAAIAMFARKKGRKVKKGV